MSDDLERWVDLEGPEPDDVRELLDAACGVPALSPEQEERMHRRMHAAVAEDRRRWARRRAVTRAVGGVVVAACVAGGSFLALHRLAARSEVAVARGGLPNVARPVTVEVGDTDRPAPAACPGSAGVPPRPPLRRGGGGARASD